MVARSRRYCVEKIMGIQFDTTFDETSVLAQLKQRIAAARQQETQSPLHYPRIVYPGLPRDILYDERLYELLQTLEQQIPVVPRGADIGRSQLDGVPVIGALWRRLRLTLHNVALFYADRALRHQLALNWHLLRVGERLLVTTQTQARQITALEAEVAALRQEA